MTGRESLLVAQVEALADDLGRLTRVAYGGDYAVFLLERLGRRVESLDAMVRPTAADLYRGHLLFGLDEDDAIREALAEADRLRDVLCRRMRLGEGGRLHPRIEEAA